VAVQKALKSVVFDFDTQDTTAVKRLFDAFAVQHSTVEKVGHLSTFFNHLSVLELLATFHQLTYLNLRLLRLENVDAQQITNAKGFKKLTFLDLAYSKICE